MPKEPDGRATGEAYVSFASEFDANRAIRDLNKKYLGSRYVDLFPA